MAQQIQEVFWFTSADHQDLLYVSPTFEAVWGRSCESLYTYPGGFLNLLVDSIHPGDRERVSTAIAGQQHAEYREEYRIVQPDGSSRWMRSRSFPVQNQFGETWGVAGFSEDITEQKHADELLQQREEDFRALVENSPDVIFRLDRELRYVYVNPATERERGKPPQAFLGKTIYELDMPERVVSAWEQSARKIFQTGQEDEVEFRVLTPNGPKYYQARVAPEFAVDGSVESLLGIVRDLTKTKQTEEALRKSEESFRTLFESAPVGIMVANSHGGLIQTNQALQKILGYTEAELQDLTFIELTHPDDRTQSIKRFEELRLAGPTRFNLEKRYCRKDGRTVWANVSVSVICDANGLLDYAIVMIEDISDRKQAQLALQTAHNDLEQRVAERTAELAQANLRLQQEIVERKLAETALNAQKEFLQTVINISPNMIFVKDRESRFVLVNQVYADFYGTTVEHMLGLTNAELNSYQADAEQLMVQDQEVFITLEQQFIPEQAVRTLTGEERWYQTIKKPLFDHEGQVTQVLGVSADITERKLLTEELKAQKNFLQTLIDTNPNKIYVKDTEGRYVLVNQVCADFHGMTIDEVLGKTDAQLNRYPENTAQFVAQDQEVLTTLKEQFSPGAACRHASGEERWYQTLKKPLFSPQGEVICIFGVSTDITERKLAEEALKAQQEFLQTVLDANPTLIFVKDLEGKYLLANQACADFHEMSVEDLLGKTDTDANLSQADAEQFIAQDQDVITTAQEQFFPEEVSCNLSGEVRWFQTMKKPIFDREGQVTQVFGVCTDITKRKQAETALKAQQEFLQTVLDTNPTLIFVKDLEGKYVLVNQACADFHERTVAEVLGKTDREFRLNQTDAQQIIAQDQEIIATLQQQTILEMSHTPSGEVRWFQTMKKPIFDAEGQLTQIFGVCTDITKRKQAEAERDRFFDVSLDMLVIGTFAGYFTRLNSAWSKTLGYTSEELQSVPFLDFVHPDDRARTIAAMETLTSGSNLSNLENRYRCKDGSYRWLAWTAFAFVDEGLIYGAARDVTPAKQAEEQLRQSEARLRLALKSARMGFWSWNLETDQVEGSANLEQLYGWPASTYNEFYKTFVELIHPEDRDHFHRVNQHSIETGEDCTLEFRVIWPDRSLHWIESKGQVIYESGQPVQMTGIDLDITERKQAETQIKASLREKEVLLQEIHHRVKNNLQVVCSLLDLQSQHLEDPASQKMFQESQTRIKSMALVHEKLYESQDCAKINFAEYVESLTGYLVQAYGVEATTVSLKLDIEVVELSIDSAIPCGLIINELVSNALKHAFPNHTEGIIQITFRAEQSHDLILVVKDNGVGFPNHVVDIPETLGLQLVNVLIEQLEGTLEITCNGGTEIRLNFSEPSD